jgi:hypothetical protein
MEEDMRLYEKMMEPCILMTETQTEDGEGGYRTKWTERTEIQAAIVKDTSMTARVAEKEGVTSTFTVTTPRNTVLVFHDVIKRVSDGRYFRVTSDRDVTSPNVSSIGIAQVSAEKWELTDDEGNST